MRFLVASDYSLLYLGGAQTAMMRQADALAAAGHRVVVLAPGASEIAPHPAIVRLEPPRTAVLPGLRLPLFRQSRDLTVFIDALLERHAFDAVLLHSEFGLAAAVTARARREGIPVLHTVHTFFWRAPVLAAPLAPLARRGHGRLTGLRPSRMRLAKRPFDSALRGMTLAMAQEADVVLSPSRHQAERLRAAGLRRVEVVSNVTESASAPLPLPRSEPLRLAWIGRFAPEKRLAVAVRAVARTRHEASLAVAGGAPGPRLLGAAPGRVEWCGRLDADAVAALLDRSHAVLITSHGFDNQPMVALEAFSRGRPVVVADPALAREFGGAAILAPTPEVEGLSRTLDLLAREPWRLEFAALDAAHAASRSSAETQV